LDRNIHIAPEEFEIIEQYLTQQLPAEEQDAFTKRLSNDNALKNKLESVRLLLLGVQEVSLVHKIEDFHEELKKSPKENSSTGKLFSMKQWLVAASVIGIAVLGVLLFLTIHGKEEKIFSAYYKPDPGLISAMGHSDNYAFDRAMIDYKTKNYDSAIKAWENLLTTNPDNDTLNYFIGSAYLAKKEADKALEHFKKVMANSNSYFLNDACWYAGLALVNEGRIEEAVPLISKSEHTGKEGLLLRLKK